MLSSDDPVVLLQHGGLDSLTGKTGLAMLRHRRGPIVAVIDPAHAGGSLEAITGIPRAVPVVADLKEALRHGPKVAVVGLAPSGGRLPEPLRLDALAALNSGLSLASGLHTRLGEDPAFAAACQPGRWIWDLRQEPCDLVVAGARHPGIVLNLSRHGGEDRRGVDTLPTVVGKPAVFLGPPDPPALGNLLLRSVPCDLFREGGV